MGHLETGVPFFLPMTLSQKLTINFPELQATQLCVHLSNNTIIGTEYSQRQSSDKDINNSEFAQEVKRAVQIYFQNPDYVFSLPCNLSMGTTFQQKVWRSLQQIPSGEVRTYGELARELNTSARAIGNACRHNRFPLIVPCHRVVSAAGVGGFAGDTEDKQKGEMTFIQIKQWLLSHEQASY